MGGFRKVAALYDSSVAINLHTQSGSDQCDESPQTREFSRKPDTVIVHNTNNSEITRDKMVRELYRYKTTCISCKGIMKRVRILLDEVRAIRKNKVYAICEHCKRTGLKCKRCAYILGKFKDRKIEEQEQLFKQWLSKVKQLLETISKGNICQHEMYQETTDAAELNKLFMELSSPMLAQRHLDIGAFPPMELQEDLAQSKDMLQELMQKLRNECAAKRFSSDDSLFLPVSETGCVCKYLMDRKTDQNRALEALTQKEIEPPKETRAASKMKIVSKTDQKEMVVTKEPGVTEKKKSKKGSSTTEGSLKDKKSTKAIRGSSTEGTETVKSNKARKGSSTIEKTVKTDKADKENKPATEKKQKNPVPSEESRLFKKLLSERTKNKEKVVKQPKEIKAKLPVFAELPKLKTPKRKTVVEDFSDSILACDDEMRSPKEMIAGTKIVPFREHTEVVKPDYVQPLLYKLEADCPPTVDGEEPEAATLTNLGTAAVKKNVIQDNYGSGIIRYRLSDRQFIDKGWTQLPTTKIFRRMNVYKMLPVVTNNGWFARHRHMGTMFYESGEKLAMIEEDGQGKWYYKNGMVALEYYNAEEMFVEKRCVVYSCDACISKPKSQTVLACFDYLGNGIVYDCRGNERLKYNQTEGQLIDGRIGPPGFWKWHTLNDPPVLHKAFIDTHDEASSGFKLARDNEEEITNHIDANDAMLAVEIENFARQKAGKLLQTFKPFQIRMKTVKINNYFTLRVIDQANIYLLFRSGRLTLKLDLGMLLQSKEIIDSVSAELCCVGTPYDRRPARSMSVQRLQDIIVATKGRKRGCST